MHGIILGFHILVASVMTISIAAVIVSAYKQRETKLYEAMLVTFGGTVLSGIALLFVTAGQLGRICAMMSAFTLGVFAARAYYRRRINSLQLN